MPSPLSVAVWPWASTVATLLAAVPTVVGAALDMPPILADASVPRGENEDARAQVG